MHTRAIRLAALISVVLVVPLAAAEEFVEFRDGRYLKIHSHQIVRGVVRLNLTENSYLVLPLSKLDRIESHGREVYQRLDTVDDNAPRLAEQELPDVILRSHRESNPRVVEQSWLTSAILRDRIPSRR